MYGAYGAVPQRPVDRSDPRLQPGAYIHNGTRLCEVLRALPAGLLAEDCKSGVHWTISYQRAIDLWKLVRAAPAAPDFLPDLAEAA